MLEATTIARVRLSADREAAEAILNDPVLSKLIDSVGVRDPSSLVRRDLLAHGVRVDGGILPDLNQVVDDLKARAGIQAELECFVYPSSNIDASVSKAGDRLFVLVSSDAIEKLLPQELEFVIGHEIGHVAYEHFKIPAGHLLHSDLQIEPKDAIRLLSWQRKAEISADRAGLVCCGSLDVAASAFFKVLSGLNVPHLTVNPLDFARQFDHLQEEIWQEGAEEMWGLTHPLSPLRMKSLVIFWQSEGARSHFEDAPGGRSIEACDTEIDDLLSFMDPMTHRAESGLDPMLLPFITWGGLYIAASNRVVERSELRALASIIGENQLASALEAPRQIDYYRRQFTDVLERRKGPLSGLDINRIFTALVAVVCADGSIDKSELEAMHDLAEELGIARTYVNSLIDEI